MTATDDLLASPSSHIDVTSSDIKIVWGFAGLCLVCGLNVSTGIIQLGAKTT